MEPELHGSAGVTRVPVLPKRPKVGYITSLTRGAEHRLRGATQVPGSLGGWLQAVRPLVPRPSPIAGRVRPLLPRSRA